MNVRLFICIGLGVMWSCQNDIEKFPLQKRQIKKKVNSNQTKFLNYLDLVPQIDLPLKFECEIGFDPIDIVGDSSLINKFELDEAIVIGKLFQKENYHGIIYGYAADIFYPIIIIFDDEGLKIKEIPVFELRDCIDGINSSAITTGVITKDLTIENITTVITTTDTKIDTLVKMDTLIIK